VPFLTWGSGANLAIELLDETPLVPVVVRHDPAVCGPLRLTGRSFEAPRPTETTRMDTVTADRVEAVRMDKRSAKIGELLHEAAETHHQVFRIPTGRMTTGHPGTRSGSSRSPSCRSCSAPRWSVAS
jgi:hypothetical protein